MSHVTYLLPKMAFLCHMITARNVLQYWPLCHDYSYDMIKVVCMPLRPTFVETGLCAMEDDDDTGNVHRRR